MAHLARHDSSLDRFCLTGLAFSANTTLNNRVLKLARRFIKKQVGLLFIRPGQFQAGPMTDWGTRRATWAFAGCGPRKLTSLPCAALTWSARHGRRRVRCAFSAESIHPEDAWRRAAKIWKGQQRRPFFHIRGSFRGRTRKSLSIGISAFILMMARIWEFADAKTGRCCDVAVQNLRGWKPNTCFSFSGYVMLEPVLNSETLWWE